MNITNITIDNYKSIKEPINIKVDKNHRVYTLIGKNGVGKTNILEALRLSLVRGNRFYGRNSIDLNSRYTLEISDEDVIKYFDNLDLDNKNNKNITVEFNGEKPNIKMVDAPIINFSIKKYKQKFNDIVNKYVNCLKRYVKNLKILMESEQYSMFNLEVEIENEKGEKTYFDESRYEFIKSEIERKISSFNGFIEENFKDDKFIISLSNLYSQFYFDLTMPIKLYKISDKQDFHISPIIAKALGITKFNQKEINEKLNKTIQEINTSMQDDYNRIQECIDEFNQTLSNFNNIVLIKQKEYLDNEEKAEDNYDTFCQKIYDSIFNDCYFINNEDSMLFGHDTSNRYNREMESYLNYKNPIIDAIDEFLYDNNYYNLVYELDEKSNSYKIIEGESIKETSKISDTRLETIVEIINSKFLNSNVPLFDKNEINGYVMRIDENKKLVLNVIENDSQEINFNDTSLGRRWYLTYFFVKSLLKENNYLFIDEPAVFLHPQAQIEFRKDLELLAQEKKVNIFITTHSPYMIGNNWNYVFNVEKNGSTTINSFKESKELRDIIEDLGINRANDILLNMTNKLLIVEGISDDACVKKFAKKLSYDLSNYTIFVCNGDPIICVTYLCIEEGINFKALLDYDNKKKPDPWLKSNVGYKKYLNIINNNKNCVFTHEPIKDQKGCLEDLFDKNDVDRYFTEKVIKKKKVLKIDPDKIKLGEIFEQTTLDNFEQLFKELDIPKIK